MIAGSSRPHRFPTAARSVVLLAAVIAATAAAAAAAQPGGTASGGTASDGGASTSPGVTIGIDGHYRVGRWTAVHVGTAAASARLTLQTVDGDGVRIDYVDPSSPAEATASPWRYLIPGSEAAPLVVTHSDASSAAEPIWSGHFPDASIAPQKPWILVFGDPLGVDALGRNELLGREASVVTTVIDRPERLPDHWIGYDSVDFLIINGSALPTLAALDDARAEALLEWVRGGGKVLITLGPSAATAAGSSPLLSQLVPLTDTSPRPTVIFEPSAIESFLSSEHPIDQFEGLVLPTATGRPLLIGRTTGRQTVPLIMQYTIGFGRVVALAGDLDAAPFAEWPQRIDLITTILPGLTAPPKSPSAGRRGAEVGYDDMAGQVRATLDHFSAGRSVSFSLVALAMLALFALIGPLDYFLINHWLGRPLLGWLSFPLMILGFSGLLIAWSNADWKPPAIHRLEVIDIDAASGVGRGFSWAQIYSPSAGRFDVRARHRGNLARDAAAPVLVAPFGSPGPSFGGLRIAGEDRRLPSYANRMQRTDGTLASRLTRLPLAPASSKGIAAWWHFQPQLDATSQLAVRRTTGLQGRLVNPLPVDLLDGLLLFGDWAYFLPTRLPAGGTIEAVESLRQKTFRWHLTHRQAVTGSSESEDWDATMDDDLQRVAEILLFYETAGGEEYTGLSNHPLRRLDLSYLLDNDRAVLVGRLGRSAAEVTVEGPAGMIDEGRTVSVARVILPVQRTVTHYRRESFQRD